MVVCQARRLMLPDAQRAPAGQRQDVLAGDVAEVLVPGPRGTVRGGDLLGPPQHGERRGLDDQQRSARLEQRGHARQRLVEVDDVVQRAQAQDVVVARRLAAKVLDAAQMEATLREGRPGCARG